MKSVLGLALPSAPRLSACSNSPATPEHAGEHKGEHSQEVERKGEHR